MEQPYQWNGSAHHEADPNDIQRIELRLADADVTVRPAPGGNIVLLQTDGQRGQRLRICQLGGLLTAECEPKICLWPRPRMHISLLLPPSYHGELSAELLSGRANLGGLNLRRIQCGLHAASLQIAGCTAQAGLSASVLSGQMELANVETGELTLRSASGSIRCEHVVCSKLVSSSLSGSQELGVHAGESCRLCSKSGPVRFAGSTPVLETDTKSGGQHLCADGLEQACLRAVSGRLELTVPEGPQLRQIDIRVVSGHARLNLPPQIAPIFDVEAVHGGVRCRPEEFAGGRPVPIRARMTSGKLVVASTACAPA